MKEILVQLIKALPRAEATLPEPDDGKHHFTSLRDAELYLGQFGLASVISDSFIDIDGIGYKQAGVIWHNGLEDYDAQLMDVSKIDRKAVTSKKATLFGAR